VRASESGLHSVVIQVEDAAQGFEFAKPQADHFCDQYGKSVLTVEEKSDFTGEGSEKDYKTYKKMAKVAQVGGAAASVFGGEKERNIGLGVSGVGVVADTALGAGYRYTLKFKCSP
jgi:hypothetical protein